MTMPVFVFLDQPSLMQLQQITGLYRSAGWWGEHQPDDSELVARLVSGSHCFLTAVMDGNIIAMGRAISDRASDAYIQDVTVHPAFRGQDIGTRIVEKLVDRLRNDGICWIGLIAERGSCDFYKKIGFKQMQNALPMLINDEF